MPLHDIATKHHIARFLFTARTRSIIDNATYSGLTVLLEELTTPRPEPLTTTPRAAAALPLPAETVAETVREPETSPVDPSPPSPASPVVRTPPREHRIATARRKIRERTPDRSIVAIISRGWGKLVGDVLANVLLYIGVILSGVAIFSFFSFGHFGRVVTNPDARPVVFAMVPLVFAGMTRLLRKQVSVQASADATGVIGALTLPIMLSGLFRDGSNVIVPDVGGSARWALYAAVGLICAATYLWLSRRRAVYGYLVAPMLWATAGALGLYVTFGASSYQLYAVLGAMVISVVIVAKRPAGGIAAATGRVAVVAFPAVLLTAVVFAFGNGDDPLGPSPAIAAAVTGAMLLALSLLDDVWADLHVRSRTAVRCGLANAGYVSLGLASLLTVSWLASPEWIGPVAIAYGTIVWTVHVQLGGSSVWVPRAARITIAGGTALSLLFTAPSIAVLVAANLAAGVYLISGRVAVSVRRHIRYGESDEWLISAAVWAPVALGVLGLSRLDFPVSGWALVGVGALSVTTRWFRGRASRLSDMSRYPGVALAAVSLIVALGDGAASVGNPRHTMLLIGIAVVAGASSSPWWVRGGVTMMAGFAAVVAGSSGPYGLEVAAVVAAVVSVGLLGATQISWFRPDALANAVYGTVGAVLAVTVALTSGTWGLSVGIAGAVTVVFLIQAALCEYGDLAWVIDAGRLWPSQRRTVDAVPSTLASAFLLLALLISAANSESREAIAVMSVGWALVTALVAFTGRADRFVARVSVYGFAVVGIGFGMLGGNGWITLLIVALAVGVMFVMEQRSLDLYLALSSLGGAVTWFTAGHTDVETALLVFTVSGGVMLIGTSVWALVSSNRTATVTRKPFIVLGSATMAVGGLAMVLRVLAEYVGGPLHTPGAGLTVLGVAAASAFGGYVFRWRWAGIVVAAVLPLGYVLTAWTLTADPLHPGVVAPIAGVLVLVGYGLSDRRVLDPRTSPASATMLGSILTATVSVVAAAGTTYVPWAFVLLAAVVGVARFFWGAVALRYLSALLWFMAAATFSPDVLLVGTLVLVPVTARWETSTRSFEAAVLRWAAAVLVAMSYGGAIDVFTPPSATAGALALGFGIFAATFAAVVVTTRRAASLRCWWPQIASLGRAGMLTGVVQLGSSSETAALFALALWMATESGISARFAVIRSSRVLAWVASTLAVVSGLFLASAADAPLVPTAFMWWFIGMSGLVAWTTVVRRSAGTIWNGPLGFSAHGAVALAALTIALDTGSVMLVRVILTASIAVFGATWLAVAHRSRSRILAAAGSVALAAAWCVAVGSTGDVASNLWRWAPAFVVAAGIWRFPSWFSSDRRSMWATSAGFTTVAMFFVLMVAAFEPGDRTSWMRAGLVAIVGAIAGRGTVNLPGTRLDGTVVSRGLVVASSWLVAGWYLPDDPGSIAVLVGVTMAGAGIAVLTAARPSGVGSLDAWTWVMVHAGAALPAFIVFGWPDLLTVFVMVVVAASIVSRGVLGGSRRLTMAGVEAFIGIGAALLFGGRSVTTVTGAVIGSAIVLIATETERLIAVARDEHPAGWIQMVEWLGLLAVPTTTILAGLENLTYTPVLATYGAGVLVWGIITQVRRRVFAGVLSILAAVVLTVATPIAAAAAVGMATAGGVGATFAIGVSVIGIAILLERYHDKLGTTMSRMSDAMADWE